MVVGLATSYATAMALTIRESPVVAVAELIIRITPGPLAERIIRFVGQLDKPLLIFGIMRLPAGDGRAGRDCSARTSVIKPILVWLVLAVLGGGAVMVQPGARIIDLAARGRRLRDLGDRAVGAGRVPSSRARHHPELESRERRVFLMVAGVLGLAASASPARAGSWAAVVATSPRAAGCSGSTA